MNNELLTIIGYLERDRGIDREVLIEAVETAMQSAARKTIDGDRELRVHVDRKTFDIHAWETLEVSDEEGPGALSLAAARKIDPEVEPGDTVEVEVPTRNLGRIAAQTAKQAILQKIRQAERDNVYEEFKDRIGDIVNGSVRQVIRGDILVDLNRAEAIIPYKERAPGENYMPGDRIRAYVLDVQHNPVGPSVILSRAATAFVKTLFRLEVSEIAEGVVEIMAIARDPGFRTKIAVRSHDEKVDPVGACVGIRGARVKNIVRELGGEKIDIVRWSEDARVYAAQALSPARLASVLVDEEQPNTLRVVVDEDQLSLAIGKRGQNVRLASRLIGWRLDVQKIESEQSFEEQVAHAIDHLAMLPDISREEAELLVKNGFLTLDGILAVDVEELRDTLETDEETAQRLLNAAANAGAGTEV